MNYSPKIIALYTRIYILTYIIMQGFIALFKKFATFITYYPFIMNFNKYLTGMKKDYL